jgi:hypothetical protein
MADLLKKTFTTEPERTKWVKWKAGDIVNVFLSEDENGYHVEYLDTYKPNHFDSDRSGNRGNYQKFGY